MTTCVDVSNFAIGSGGKYVIGILDYLNNQNDKITKHKLNNILQSANRLEIPRL
jgi:hypothetical protein